MAIVISGRCGNLITLQQGVIGREQAIDAGLSATSIKTLLRTKRWQRIHRGVYTAFTGPPRTEALIWAALVRLDRTAC